MGDRSKGQEPEVLEPNRLREQGCQSLEEESFGLGQEREEDEVDFLACEHGGDLEVPV